MYDPTIVVPKDFVPRVGRVAEERVAKKLELQRTMSDQALRAEKKRRYNALVKEVEPPRVAKVAEHRVRLLCSRCRGRAQTIAHTHDRLR